MSQDRETVGAIGLLKIDALEITIAPLSQAEELALDRALRKAAEATYGDYWTRCKPELDAMARAGASADRLEFVRELARMAARREPLSAAAMFDFECSPAGLAIAIHARGRKATPGLTRAALEAVLTDANADQIASAFFELTRGGPDSKSTAA